MDIGAGMAPPSPPGCFSEVLFLKDFKQDDSLDKSTAGARMIGTLPKPFRPLPLKPRRLLKESNVTIALGFRTNDGVVIAADSQETISGYIKGNKGKVRLTLYSNGNALVFTGSGTSDYISTAIDKAGEDLHKIDNFTDIRYELEERLLAFFNKHIAPWAYFPESERPSVELLIGVSCRKGGHGLFHYSGTAFHSVGEKAIGSGVLLANGLISQLFSVADSVTQATKLAVYILSKSKKQVDGCGGFTSLMALKGKGDWLLTETKDVEQMEKECEELEGRSIKSLRNEIVNRPFEMLWHSEFMARKKALKSKTEPK
ncbi:MAG: hypothetical protein WBF06_10175 [Candidatus Acidiferrales bacterium]